MPSSTTTTVCYVYGIVPATLDPTSAPEGLDDTRVSLEASAGVAALVSSVDGVVYEAESLERNTGDVEWMSRRAIAHDRVLTWASERGAVVPMPMFSLFSGAGAVRTMLRERSAQLGDTLRRVARGREYALRVYRVDDELMDAMTAMSPKLAELASSAAAARPGQRYLLERKLETEKREDMRSATREIVDSIMSSLSARSVDATKTAIPRTDGSTRGTMVLNAAFLVAPDRLTEFQQALTSVVERHGTHGFRFDFTGPWPPYHFTGHDGAA